LRNKHNLTFSCFVKTQCVAATLRSILLNFLYDMKAFAKIFVLLLTFTVLGGSAAQAQDHKGWSRKAKGAAIGGGAGAVTGAVIGGGKGALIGTAAGVVGGGLIGRNQDKKKDPARYYNYKGKK
jgi:osmotically inducible lipoprotein OsmB